MTMLFTTYVEMATDTGRGRADSVCSVETFDILKSCFIPVTEINI